MPGRPLCGWLQEERFKSHDVRPVSRDDSNDILPGGEDRRTTNDACFRNKPGHEPLPDGEGAVISLSSSPLPR